MLIKYKVRCDFIVLGGIVAGYVVLSSVNDAGIKGCVEGCYADLLALAVPQATEMIYLDLPTPLCIENARARPWEPHKYPSKAAQDANLNMLIDWIGQYDQRQDCFSRSAHDTLFRRFTGRKRRYVSNERED